MDPDRAPIGGPMPKRNIVAATIRRNAREQITVSLVELEGLGPFVEVRRMYVPLDSRADLFT
jgi:hypothetical protein